MASGGGLTLGTLWLQIEAQVDGATKSLQKFGNDVSDQIDAQKKKWDGLSSVGDSLLGMGAGLTAALTVPLVGFGAAAVGAADKLQIARTAFITMLGSAEAADAMLKDLQAFAASTPFEFPDLVEAAQRMKALGFQSDQIIPTLRTVGDTAAAMGKGKDAIDGITLALGQMQAKGKVSAQEMQQLAERGIPAWRYLADAIGVDIPEAMKRAENGAIKASTALPAILGGMNREFSGSMEAMSKTLSGQWSNIQDQLTMALIPIGQTLIPMLQKLLPILSAVLGAVGDMGRAFQLLPGPVQTAVVGVAALTAALGPMILTLGAAMKGIGAIAPQLSLLVSSASNVGFAVQNGLTPALMGMEKGLLVAGIAAAALAAVFAGALIGNWLADYSINAKHAADSSDNFAIGTAKLGDKINVLNKALKDGKITLEQYKAQIESIGFATKTGLGLDPAVKKAREFRAEVEKTTPSIKDLEAQLAAYGVGLVQGAASSDDYRDALIDQIAHLKESGIKTEAESKAIAKAADEKKAAADKAAALAKREEDLAAAAEASAKQHKKLTDNLADAKENLTKLEDAARRGVIGWNSTTGAVEKVAKAQEALDKELVKNNRSIIAAGGSVDDFVKSLNLSLPPLGSVGQAAQNEAIEVDAAALAADYLAEAAGATVQPLGQTAAAITGVVGPSLTAADAFRDLGLKGSGDLAYLADTAWRSYDLISEAAGTSAEMQRRAFLIATQAQAEYEASLGGVTAETQLQLARIEQAERDYQNNSVNGWRNLWQNLHDGVSSMFHELNVAVFSGDWATAKDRILDDLKGMGLAVLEKFTKPAEDAIASFVANTLTDLLSGKGFGGVMDSIGGLGSALGGIFKGAGAAAASAGSGLAVDAGGAAISSLPLDRIIPGIAKTAASTAASTASSVAGGIMKGVVGALNPISMVADVVGSVAQVLQLFGVGREGEKDRLNRISDATGFLAWAYDEGRVYLNIWDIRNALQTAIPARLDGIAASVDRIDQTLAAMNQPGKTFEITMTGTDPQAVAAYLATALRAQGAAA